MCSVIYAVKASFMPYFKIGYSTVSLHQLRSRYEMVYGNDLQWHLFLIEAHQDPRTFEELTHTALAQYWVSHELFLVGCLPSLELFMTGRGVARVEMPRSRVPQFKRFMQYVIEPGQEFASHEDPFSTLCQVLCQNDRYTYRAHCVTELIRALGFCHPLDTDTVITSLEPMKDLSFVQHWDRNSRAFLSKKPVLGKTLDEKGLQEICRAVLKAIGIKLVMDFKRPRAAGGKQVKERRFRLDPESCQEAGELLHLKSVVATEFTEVMDWLEKHPLQRWKHLKDSVPMEVTS